MTDTERVARLTRALCDIAAETDDDSESDTELAARCYSLASKALYDIGVQVGDYATLATPNYGDAHG